MTVITVEGQDDERLADYRNIPDAELVERRGIFIAEGRLVVRRLLEESALAARSVMVTEPALASMEDALAARPDVPAYLVPQAVMDRVAGFNIHRGCLAIGERPASMPWPALVARARTILVLGHEGERLTAEALEACEHRARIPMGLGRTAAFDSLNVAAAAAIALYELRRG